ncbi:DNA cytosine methyltransferase [Cohnella massiliensis]|uniref:DNA cytosine methyltransferase n=1 Tax=Cohnella massiliensis TaxID=1816691 RepID=UPI00111A2055|nr:DNA cytosine methyltransferase [Cohnella massiliensis]
MTFGPCIDLFCGAGGLSCGFAQAGFDIRVGIDVDAAALLTFERNHSNTKAVKADVSQLTGAELRKWTGSDTIFGMIGGPPCQGFSVAGKHDPDDPRNRLPYEYARLLEEVQPCFLLMENVKELLSKKQRVHFDTVLELFAKAGYTLDWKLLNAWHYGVAQTRERVFIVGFRRDLDVSFTWPEADPTRPVLRDAIGDLPDPLSEETEIANHALDNPAPVSMRNRLRNAGKRRGHVRLQHSGMGPAKQNDYGASGKRCRPGASGVAAEPPWSLVFQRPESRELQAGKPDGRVGSACLYHYGAQPIGGIASESRPRSSRFRAGVELDLASG